MSKNKEKLSNKSVYQKSWEGRPFLRDWIQEVPEDPGKAYCRVCKCALYAHRYSVMKHTCTKKHQDNWQKYRSAESSALTNDVTSTLTIHEQPPKTEEDTDMGDAQDDVDEICIQSHSDIKQLEHIDSPSSEEQELFNGNSPIGDEAYIFEDDDDADTISVLNSVDTLDTDCCAYTETISLPVTNSTSCTYRESPNEKRNLSGMEPEKQEHRTISTHILDTSRGQAAANVDLTVYRLDGSEWKLLSQSATDLDGRCSQLVRKEEFSSGLYKLHFNVKVYFEANNVRSFYPFIEIVIECTAGEHYHVPLLLSPFSYSTYRGT